MLNRPLPQPSWSIVLRTIVIVTPWPLQLARQRHPVGLGP
jgi:hypothetical protein